MRQGFRTADAESVRIESVSPFFVCLSSVTAAAPPPLIYSCLLTPPSSDPKSGVGGNVGGGDGGGSRSVVVLCAWTTAYLFSPYFTLSLLLRSTSSAATPPSPVASPPPPPAPTTLSPCSNFFYILTAKCILPALGTLYCLRAAARIFVTPFRPSRPHAFFSTVFSRDNTRKKKQKKISVKK